MSNNTGIADGSLALDQLNLKIIKDMMNDADVKSTDMAERYKCPLSTIQRRRTRLERTVLKKKYHMDINRLGWREADLLISVTQSDCEELARRLMDTHRGNIVSASLRIGDPEINLMAQAFYHSTEELHRLIEGIKSETAVKSVEWSEIVKVVGTDNSRMVDRVFGNGSG